MNDITITIKKTITKQNIVDTFITACEGGSNYWCQSVTPKKKTGDAYEAMLDGFELVDAESGATYLVGPDAIKNAFQKMAEKYPLRLEDIINESADADDADVFLQLCVFEDVIYG